MNIFVPKFHSMVEKYFMKIIESFIVWILEFLLLLYIQDGRILVQLISTHLALLDVYKGRKKHVFTERRKVGKQIGVLEQLCFKTFPCFRTQEKRQKVVRQFEKNVRSSNFSDKMLSDEERDIDVESDDDGR